MGRCRGGRAGVFCVSRAGAGWSSLAATEGRSSGAGSRSGGVSPPGAAVFKVQAGGASVEAARKFTLTKAAVKTTTSREINLVRMGKR